MITRKDNLYLDHITSSDAAGNIVTCPVADGLTIKMELPKETLEIARVYWSNSDNNCYIQTIGDRLQNYVVWYETYANFIYLVDEAYYKIGCQHQSEDQQKG